MNNNVLRTEKLNLYYGSFHALLDVDFHAFGKSITALIGPVRVWQIHITPLLQPHE